jgi:hypothetical protein
MATIASFVALSAFGSLGLSLNLFFVLMLFTPMAVHDDDSIRHDALFAPKAIVLYIPVIGALAVEEYLPVLLAHRANLNAFRLVYLGVPLFLAFAPEVLDKPMFKFRTKLTCLDRSKTLGKAPRIQSICTSLICSSFLRSGSHFVVAPLEATGDEPACEYTSRSLFGV